MPISVLIRLTPAQAADQQLLEEAIFKAGGIATGSGHRLRLSKRSIDSRGKQVIIQIAAEIFGPNETLPEVSYRQTYQQVSASKAVHIIGSGPAGLFAALRLLEKGFKPIIIERGQPVRERRRDLVDLIRNHHVNPDSNYCFGEGGAGTFSDGKLYTRSQKRGDVNRILRIFTENGAHSDILVDAHPHIGTNKLPQIIERMREIIIEHGGEVRFGQRVTDFELANDKLTGLVINGSVKEPVQAVIMATGHSASDVYYLLHRHGVEMEAKEYALGVRVEHPQSVIDAAVYHCNVRDPLLPPGAYAVVEQVRGRGVYSFCMCPGGVIAPCATSDGEVVTNGWSPDKRNLPFANSGMVVTVDEQARNAFAEHGPLAGLKLREFVEQTCSRAAGGTQAAPAQRLVDFMHARPSENLPPCSYLPGVVASRLDLLLPPDISLRLREAFVLFGKKIKGFHHPDAIVVGPESRTSSPVRIPRDESGQHIRIKGLFPCGEGAGYAGGIVSAAMDGERMADCTALIMGKVHGQFE